MNPTREQRMVAIREAAEWTLRLEEAPLDQLHRRQFQVWLQSPLNLVEISRICLIDALLQGLALKTDAGPKPSANVINFESYAPMTRPRPSEPLTTRPARRFSSRNIAAAACLVMAIAALMLMIDLVSTQRAIVTRSGQWDKQLLEDGTVVYVGPATELRFKFNDEARSVVLVRGEAFFDVAKDPGRPFVVATDKGSVKAVGTEFATAYTGGSVVVTVAEGKVAVTPTATGHSQRRAIPLMANQQLMLSVSGAGDPVPVNAGREVKWVRNWYEFDAETVCEIVDQLNQRYAARIVVEDVQVCRLRMDALTFKPSEPEDFIAKINRWYSAAVRSETAVLRLERS